MPILLDQSRCQPVIDRSNHGPIGGICSLLHDTFTWMRPAGARGGRTGPETPCRVEEGASRQFRHPGHAPGAEVGGWTDGLSGRRWRAPARTPGDRRRPISARGGQTALNGAVVVSGRSNRFRPPGGADRPETGPAGRKVGVERACSGWIVGQLAHLLA